MVLEKEVRLFSILDFLSSLYLWKSFPDHKSYPLNIISNWPIDKQSSHSQPSQSSKSTWTWTWISGSRSRSMKTSPSLQSGVALALRSRGKSIPFNSTSIRSINTSNTFNQTRSITRSSASTSFSISRTYSTNPTPPNQPPSTPTSSSNDPESSKQQDKAKDRAAVGVSLSSQSNSSSIISIWPTLPSSPSAIQPTSGTSIPSHRSWSTVLLPIGKINSFSQKGIRESRC